MTNARESGRGGGPPLNMRELAERRPILGTGKPPPELQALRSRSSIFIAGAGTEKPAIAVDAVAPDPVEGRPGGWRIDITLSEGQQIDVLPRLQLHRERPEFFRQGIDRSVSLPGYRPDWIDMTYLPRLHPPRELRPMRRLNGRLTRPLWVLGTDHRQLFRDSSYPWGAIGLIANNEGYTGSGAMVANNIVLTAAHMIPWSSGANGWVKFTPADYLGLGSLFGANVYSMASQVYAYDNGMNVSGYDWAILRLVQPLGSMTGFMGWNAFSDDWEGQPWWTVVGYPSGVGPFWQGGIDVNDEDSDSHGGEELESVTADITGGNSGGPMFGFWGAEARIIGVVSGEEVEYVFPASSHQDNVFAAGNGLHDLIAWGRSNW